MHKLIQLYYGGQIRLSSAGGNRLIFTSIERTLVLKSEEVAQIVSALCDWYAEEGGELEGQLTSNQGDSSS